MKNIVADENDLLQNEKKKEKEKDSSTCYKDVIKRSNKKPSGEDQHLSTERQESSTSSNGGIQKKKSFIERISHFRKSKSRDSMKPNCFNFPSISIDDQPKLPSKDEILSWSVPNNGFENMMASKAGRTIFAKFLQKEFSSENLSFWTAFCHLEVFVRMRYLKK